MTTVQTQHITSRDNAFLKDLRRLSQDNTAYRKQGRFWVEGDHLCRAATREALSMALNEFEGTVMLVSHDRALLRAVCDEFWMGPAACGSASLRPRPVRSTARSSIRCATLSAHSGSAMRIT